MEEDYDFTTNNKTITFRGKFAYFADGRKFVIQIDEYQSYIQFRNQLESGVKYPTRVLKIYTGKDKNELTTEVTVAFATGTDKSMYKEFLGKYVTINARQVFYSFVSKGRHCTGYRLIVEDIEE